MTIFNSHVSLPEGRRLSNHVKKTHLALGNQTWRRLEIPPSEEFDDFPSELNILSVWWYTYPSEKYDFVSWDYDIPNTLW